MEYPQLVYPYIEKEVKLATPIRLGRMCELGQVSRVGFYRWQLAKSAPNRRANYFGLELHAQICESRARNASTSGSQIVTPRSVAERCGHPARVLRIHCS
jgi:hypothetical protein